MTFPMAGNLQSDASPSSILSRAARVIAECRLIASMTEEPGHTTRRFLTPAVAEVHAHLRAQMEALGMRVHTDAIGNLRGIWQPERTSGKRLLLGSHIDTVPNAGAFDGVLGVVLALEWVRIAQQLAVTRPIEVIAFSEEEGVRYGVPFLGSRTLAGTFDMKMLAYQDADGISMEQAIRNFGLDPARIPQARIDEDILGYLEIHIEQGPVLESEDLQLAIVTGIAGQSRLGFRLTGHANHAGTTPMHLRHDALAAAADWMHQIEAIARRTEGLVITVGKLALEPNASNVIPGAADLSLDVRHISDRTREAAVHQCLLLVETIAQRRGLTVESVLTMNERSVNMDTALSSDLAAALKASGYPAKRMPSGAGHDAMIMAQRVPSSMLFLRSPGGISHHPGESVREDDVAAAIQVGYSYLDRIGHPQAG